MATRTFEELVQDLKQRREVADLPPVLLIGAGASLAAGIGAMADLFAFVKRDSFESFVEYIEPLTAAERYRLLARFLQTRKPEEPTAGYQALAKLCEQAYFDIILTTNLDPLLDDALTRQRLWRKDYMLLVNGIIRTDRLATLLSAQSPRLKIVKLHGDLFQRFMAWTPDEMDSYLEEIIPHLKPALKSRDLLVVGYSMRDERVRELALSTDGAVWYTNPREVPDFLAGEERLRAIVSDKMTFEYIFPALVTALGYGESAEVIAEDVQTRRWRGVEAAAAGGTERIKGSITIDDFLTCVVSILGPDDTPSSTGFVLSEPRVIVADGYVAGTGYGVKNKKVKIMSSDGRRFEATVKSINKEHPFGPWILEVPANYDAVGLRLNRNRLRRDTHVTIGVAAGERIGVSKGIIRDPAAKVISVEPLGRVQDLVAVEALVKPGASGAPVVNNNFEVEGFIVAGSIDRLPSYMLPTSHWAAALASKPRPAMRGSAGRPKRARGNPEGKGSER
jgi:S1-C subfamily serine protease